MKFTGTLIDDLVAAVERAELKTLTNEAADAVGSRTSFDGVSLVEASLAEPWFASFRKANEFDSKFLGVA